MKHRTSIRRRLRGRLKHFLTLPISPNIFRALVDLLRKIGVLRKPILNKTGIQRVFISHPYSSVGDLVLLLPLLEKIRAEWPDAILDVVVGSGASELLAGVPGLHRIFVCGSQRSRVPLFGIYRRFFRNLLFYRRQIMPLDYDLAIAPRWGSIMTSEAVYLAYLTGAPNRVGYAAGVDDGDSTLDELLTVAVSGGHGEHETTRNLRLLDRAGLTEKRWLNEPAVNQPIQSLVKLAATTDGSSRTAGSILQTLQLPGRYAVISPGATRPFNRWPLERLASVIRKLHQESELPFYIVGSAPDALLCRDLVHRVRGCATSVAGDTNLRELTYLLSKATLFLGMDSGTAHIAGGLGTPTIVISPFPSSCREEHPNSPIRFRPCGPRVRVLQPAHPLSPCRPTCSFRGPHCIKQVSVDDVVIAATDLLTLGRGSTS